MMFKTHLAFAFLISLLIFNYFNLNPILFVIFILIGSLTPDLDHGKSKISRKLWPISMIIKFIFKHRGLFHSLIFAAIISLIIKLLIGNYSIPFFIGFLSHLFTDALTKQGVNFLYPIKFFKIKGFIRTNSFLEKILFFIILLLILVRIIILI